MVSENYNDYWDQAYDEAMASEAYQQQIEDTKIEGIEEYQEERLQEYYLENSDLLQVIEIHLKKVKKVVDAGFPEAGVVFSFMIIELILKEIFLKPLLSGSFLYQHISDEVVEEVLKSKNDAIKKILFYILKSTANINFKTYKRPRKKVTLWGEIMNQQIRRNRIIHRGSSATQKEARYTYNIAFHLKNSVLPFILQEIGLTIKGGKIVNK